MSGSSHAYLSNRTEYARGYKSGIYAAKEIILDYLKELEEMTTTNFNITNRTQDVADKELNNLFDELVPNSGKASTKAGEIVRAMARLAYRWYNDGDKLGEGYGRVTCNPAGRFLCDKVQGISHKLGKIYAVYNNDDYEQGLLHVQNYVIDFINANPQLKEEANDEDFWDWRDEDEDVDDTDEDEEY